MEGVIAGLLTQGILGLTTVLFLGLWLKSLGANSELQEKRHQEVLAINIKFAELAVGVNASLQMNTVAQNRLADLIERRDR